MRVCVRVRAGRQRGARAHPRAGQGRAAVRAPNEGQHRSGAGRGGGGCAPRVVVGARVEGHPGLPGGSHGAGACGGGGRRGGGPCGGAGAGAGGAPAHIRPCATPAALRAATQPARLPQPAAVASTDSKRVRPAPAPRPPQAAPKSELLAECIPEATKNMVLMLLNKVRACCSTWCSWPGARRTNKCARGAPQAWCLAPAACRGWHAFGPTPPHIHQLRSMLLLPPHAGRAAAR